MALTTLLVVVVVIAVQYSNTYMNVAGIAFSDMLKKKFYKQLEEEEKKRLGEMKAVS